MSGFEEDFLTLSNTMNAWQDSWNALRSSLVAEVLRRNGQYRVRGEIRGESMLPTLWPGDVVEVESCSLKNIRLGEIVLAQRDDRLVLHRVVGFTPNAFLLRGDCVPTRDPLLPPEALLGRLASRSTQGQIVRLLGSRWARAWGVLLCYCGIARRLALKIHGWRNCLRRLRYDPRQRVFSTLRETGQAQSLHS